MINQEGIELIKRWEGCDLTSYPDDASPLAQACVAAHVRLTHYDRIPGWENIRGTPWTIGYGATGEDIKPGMVWTEAEAEARLVVELEEHMGYVRSICADMPLTSNQFAALTSITYNAGPSNLKRLISQGYENIAERFIMFNKAQGLEMQGLTDRRIDEKRLYLKPD